MLTAHQKSGTRHPGPLAETQDQTPRWDPGPGTRDPISRTLDLGSQNFQVGPGAWDLGPEVGC